MCSRLLIRCWKFWIKNYTKYLYVYCVIHFFGVCKITTPQDTHFNLPFDNISYSHQKIELFLKLFYDNCKLSVNLKLKLQIFHLKYSYFVFCQRFSFRKHRRCTRKWRNCGAVFCAAGSIFRRETLDYKATDMTCAVTFYLHHTCSYWIISVLLTK